MANLKRLTDRVKKLEKWNEDNGDGDNAMNMHYLIRSVRQAGDMLQSEQQNFANFKNLVFEWMSDREHGDDWNEFIKEKEDAVQEQPTEEVPVQEQAESSEKAIEEEE
jgi:hypothetical protein|tara:strand:+ start:5697 stop:6020 length:324 start_codon:yes stop_codon:yes gene_type:complete